MRRSAEGALHRAWTLALLLPLAGSAGAVARAAPQDDAPQLSRPAPRPAAPVPVRRAPGEVDPVRWRGGILLDDAVRQHLRAPQEAVRARAAAVSDVLLRLAIAFPLLACALLLSLLRRRVPRATAARLFAASALALCLTGGVHAGVSRVVARERPYVQECAAPAPPPECGRSEASGRVSFYSGHTAVAFTALGLVLLHLRSTGLGGTLLGGVLMGLASLGAVATGLLRIVSDRHYLSDVLAGALLGLAAALLAARVLRLGARGAAAAPLRREAGRRLQGPLSAPEGD